MKSVFIKSVLAIVAVSFISSCASNEIGHSKDVNQDEINQGYSIYYNQVNKAAEITAFFRFAGPNGTTLILDKPSTVNLNGEELNLVESDSRGAYYSKVFEDVIPDREYELVFSDINGEIYTNRVKWKNIKVDSVPLSIESNHDDLIIKFDSDPDNRFEEVEVSISDAEQTVTEIFKNVVMKRVVIKADKLKPLHGKAEVSIKRYGYHHLKQQAHAGGYFNTQYELKPFEITILE